MQRQKAKGSGKTSRQVNLYLDESKSEIVECYSDLKSESKALKPQLIKARFLIEDKRMHSLRNIFKYHNDKEFEQEWLRLDLKESHVKKLIRAGFTSNNFKTFPVRRDLYKQGQHLNTRQAIVIVDYPMLGQQQFLF